MLLGIDWRNCDHEDAKRIFTTRRKHAKMFLDEAEAWELQNKKRIAKYKRNVAGRQYLLADLLQTRYLWNSTPFITEYLSKRRKR